VILLGEVRDAATMEVALQAAETGHLVFSSIHTPDVPRTIGRLLSMSASPQETRDRLSECLQGVVAQRLVRRREGPGLVLVSEVLIVTGTVRTSIKRPEQNPSLRELMEKGVTPYGMQTFQMAIERLVAEGVVDQELVKATAGF